MAKVIKIRIASTDSSEVQKTVSGIGRPNEEINNRFLYQQCGFQSVPYAGSVGLGIADGDNIAIVGTSDTDSNKPAISEEGDVSIHRDSEKYVLLDADTVEIKYDDTTIELNSSGVVIDMDGKLTINNAVEDLAEIMSDLLDKIIAIQTVGSPPQHILWPQSITDLTAIKVRLASLLEAS